MTTVLALLLTACTTTVDVAVTGDGDEGESSSGSVSTTAPWGSTGLSGSETGAPGSTGALESSGGSTGFTGGSDTGQSTDAGSEATGGESSTGPACTPALAIFYWNDIPRCECDGEPVDPALCGCSFTAAGCECNGEQHEEVTCGWPCQPGGWTTCTCGNFPADPEFCEDGGLSTGASDCAVIEADDGNTCVCDGVEVDISACWCPDLVPPQSCIE